MHYTITHDRVGRLRLRCGKWAFTEEEGRGISESLSSLEGTVTVQARPANGSILIEYEGDIRQKLLDTVRGLSHADLPLPTTEAVHDLRTLDNNFFLNLTQMVGGHLFRRFFLPPIIRNIIVLYQALSFLREGFKFLAQGRMTVEVLDAAAVTTAILRRQFTSASSIMFLLRISELLEEYTHARTRYALQDSLLLRAETVWVVEDGRDVETSLERLTLGRQVRVRTGALIPVDATVVSGEGEVNEASMTGESALVHKRPGSTVFAGTVLDDGSLIVSVDALPGSSRIDRIVAMVDESEALKADIQSRAERLADSVVPFSFAAFAGVLLVTRNMTKASNVLMVDYSCAIKLSTPVAVMSAMREAMNYEIVVKGGKFLEAFARADTVVFDKTGTLTEANPEVQKVLSFSDMDESEILRTAACLEEHFPHSVARAIVRAAYEKGLRHEEEAHAEVEYIVAHGIVTRLEGRRACIGSAHFIFEDEGVPRPDDLDDVLKREGGVSSTVFLAIDGALAGVIFIADPVRDEAKSVLDGLRERGFTNLVMLTGDSENCAAAIAEQLDIDTYRSQMLPEQKALYIEELKAQGHTVVMVGDGINDSPALAAANVSVALSDASDIARAVADVTVLNASLEALLFIHDISASLMRRIDRDYRFIVVFNTLLMVAGVVGFLQPTTSALLHNLSTVGITAYNTRPLLAGRKAKRLIGGSSETEAPCEMRDELSRGAFREGEQDGKS